MQRNSTFSKSKSEVSKSNVTPKTTPEKLGAQMEMALVSQSIVPLFQSTIDDYGRMVYVPSRLTQCESCMKKCIWRSQCTCSEITGLFTRTRFHFNLL